MQPRLNAEFWVKAHIRRCYAEDVTAVVVRRGFEKAGTVLLKLNAFEDGCVVLTPTTDMNGGRVWLRGTGADPVAEAEADAYIARQVDRDPDLWVLEIEDRQGRHFLDDPIE